MSVWRWMTGLCVEWMNRKGVWRSVTGLGVEWMNSSKGECVEVDDSVGCGVNEREKG